ncbi:Uncharacterized protein APZ42_016343 [Daphnia magna]|uniref:Uncharacterized protein n=1 Tax=Daphnia magna TaxID=35525 RepID=A0A165ACT5_9CRUS|nr:Uncharacterized protein APZ42_016343 [Daphnia magna]
MIIIKGKKNTWKRCNPTVTNKNKVSSDVVCRMLYEIRLQQVAGKKKTQIEVRLKCGEMAHEM